MKFEIKVPAKGKLPGTTGWLNDQLSSSSLEVSTTSKGNTCLVHVRYQNELGQSLNNPLRLVIAVIDGETKASHYHENEYLKRVFVQDTNMQVGLFETILTPAAYQIAENFLLEAINNFWDSFQNDFQECLEIKA